METTATLFLIVFSTSSNKHFSCIMRCLINTVAITQIQQTLLHCDRLFYLYTRANYGNISFSKPIRYRNVYPMYRLWNSTLMADYPKVDKVSISSRAKIHIPPSLIIHQDTSDDVAKVCFYVIIIIQ